MEVLENAAKTHTPEGEGEIIPYAPIFPQSGSTGIDCLLHAELDRVM